MAVRWVMLMVVGLAACSANVATSEASGTGTSSATSVEPASTSDSTEAVPADSSSGVVDTSGSGPADASTGASESSTGNTQAGCNETLPVIGEPCEGDESCGYADFCAAGVYECMQGAWEFRVTHGCGAEVVDCEDGPEADNGCDTIEACDPDGDCLDVLECDGSNWVEREVCNAIACPEANPINGQPCDDPYWVCPLEHPCGVPREYRCSNNDNHWFVVARAAETCTEPAACVDGPIPGDACALEAEVCTFAAPSHDALTCTDGVWT